LLVLGRDAQSTQETVEVAHEALVRSWGELRGWLREDRDFLLWRQQFQVLVSIWENSDHTAFLSGAALKDALKWQGAKRDSLSTRELEFIDKSHQLERSGERHASEVRVLILVSVTVLIASLIAALGWLAYSRTETYQIKSILKANLEDSVFIPAEEPRNEKTGILPFVTLLSLGREKQLEAAALKAKPEKQARRLTLLGVALVSIGKSDEGSRLLWQAEGLLNGAEPAVLMSEGTQVVRILLDNNMVSRGAALLSKLNDVPVEKSSPVDLATEGELWIRLANRPRGEARLNDAARVALAKMDTEARAYDVIRVAEAYDADGGRAKAISLLNSAVAEVSKTQDYDVRESAYGSLAAALARYGETAKALELASPANIHNAIGRHEPLTAVCEEYVRTSNIDGALALAPEIEKTHYTAIDCLEAIAKHLIDSGKVDEAMRLVHGAETFERGQLQRSIVQQLARSGDTDRARQLLNEMAGNRRDNEQRSLAAFFVARALWERGQPKMAETLLNEAKRLAIELGVDDIERSVALGPVCALYAFMGYYRDARLVAESMPNEFRRKFALQNILDAYIGKKKALGVSLDVLLTYSPDEL
jgi:tetratricopeptide (TPR) repeat protein